MKIVSFGFVLNKGTYLRNLWNILDGAIVAVAWSGGIAELVHSGGSTDLKALR